MPAAADVAIAHRAYVFDAAGLDLDHVAADGHHLVRIDILGSDVALRPGLCRAQDRLGVLILLCPCDVVSVELLPGVGGVAGNRGRARSRLQPPECSRAGVAGGASRSGRCRLCVAADVGGVLDGV